MTRREALRILRKERRDYPRDSPLGQAIGRGIIALQSTTDWAFYALLNLIHNISPLPVEKNARNAIVNMLNNEAQARGYWGGWEEALLKFRPDPKDSAEVSKVIGVEVIEVPNAAIRRAHKGEIRCEECRHFSHGYNGLGDCTHPEVMTFVRDDNTCDMAQHREEKES